MNIGPDDDREIVLRRRCLKFICVALIVCPPIAGFVGCSFWNRPRSVHYNGLRLGNLRMPSRGVAVMVAVMPLSGSQVDEFNELWSQWDQMAIGLVQRRAWDANGLRIALAPAHLPGEFLRFLEQPSSEPSSADAGLSEPNPLADPQQQKQRSAWRVTLREGKPKLVTLSPVVAAANWTVATESAEKPGNGEQVSALMQLTAYPDSDGTVRVLLRPLIRHGQPKTRVGVLDNSLAIETTPTEEVLDELRVDVRIRSGQTVIATCAAEPTDLGKLMFAEPGTATSPNIRVLLIRLVQIQADGVFGAK